MKVSLICTVLNEADNIAVFMDSLNQQTRLPDEVVICDAGSTDGTVKILQEFGQIFPRPVKVIVEQGNRSHGRNVAIHHAKHDIIAGTDAGCLLDQRWLELLLTPFERDPSVDVVSGFYEARGETVFEKCVAVVTLSTRGINPDTFLPSGRSIAFKKCAWQAVGGFPEHLEFAEDTQFGQSLRDSGFHFAIARDAIVTWRPRRSYAQVYNQYFSYAVGDAQAKLSTGSYIRHHIRYAIWVFLLLSVFVWPFMGLAWITVFAPYWLFWAVLGWHESRTLPALWIVPMAKLTMDMAKFVGWWTGRWWVDSPRTPRVLMLSISDFNFLSPALNEGRMLGANGFQVEVLTLRNHDQSAIEELAPGFRVSRLSLISRKLPKKTLSWAVKYLEFIVRAILFGMKTRRNVIVAHNLDTLFPALVISSLRGGRVLYRAHELCSELEGLSLAKYWRMLEKKLVPRADLVVVPNEERASIIKKELGARAIVVVQNCPPYSSPARNNILHKVLQMKGYSPELIALYQGRFGEDRCTDELVAAVPYLSGNITLVLLGHAPKDYISQLKDKVSKLGIAHRVAILDPVPYDDVVNYTTSADLGIVFYRNSSRNNYYCAPNKLYEYFMAGLPVVASDFPGLRALVQESGAGLVANPEEPKQIAMAINKILTDQNLATKMSKTSLRNATLLNWEIEGTRLFEAYRSLVDAAL
jgi:glycosyltransferase involved in cell wall biosynthesis